MPNDMPKTKTTYYKRGKYKGKVKKVKEISTGTVYRGDVAKQVQVKHKIKYTKTGDVKKEKIVQRGPGLKGILSAKKKVKYTQRSGVTVATEKGKVDPKKVAEKVLTAAAFGVTAAAWPKISAIGFKAGESAFGMKTVAGMAGTFGTGIATTGVATGALWQGIKGTSQTPSSRTFVKRSVTEGRDVKGAWNKMGS